jgi:hypothetical protein
MPFLVMALAWAVRWGLKLPGDRPVTPKKSTYLNPPLKKYPVTAADLAFGKKQVDQMMHDRPVMALLVKKGDVIYEWTVRQFAGESLGHRIMWYSVFH